MKFIVIAYDPESTSGLDLLTDIRATLDLAEVMAESAEFDTYKQARHVAQAAENRLNEEE